MVLIGRIIVILFALWIASMAAGLVWALGLLTGVGAPSADPIDRFVFWGAAFIASGMTATLIFMPALVAVVLAELFAIRSLLIYALAGAALTLIAYSGAGFGRSYEESIDRAPPLTRGTEVAAASGIAFGLVYWAIAGRRAGRWRERRRSPQLPPDNKKGGHDGPPSMSM